MTERSSSNDKITKYFDKMKYTLNAFEHAQLLLLLGKNITDMTMVGASPVAEYEQSLKSPERVPYGRGPKLSALRNERSMSA